jgi:flavorubredoxin
MSERISDMIRYVGVNDLAKDIFESQWPLLFGVSYNSYLIVDEKIALVDTAAANFSNEFFNNIRAEIGERKINYLIVNHMEPDHSALISFIRAKYPDIVIVTNAKAVPMIEGFNGITDKIHIVKEGDSLSLGHATLKFYMIPMVHWPETMVTYLEDEKTLFSGDAFGSFGALESGIQDSNVHLYSHKTPLPESISSSDAYSAFEDEMIRYYSNIVGKYGPSVQAALKKLGGLSIARICSTHGPIWEKQVNKVVSLYDRLSKYETSKGVCIVYGSMYGNTEKAAFALASELEKRNIRFVIHNLATENASFAYRDVFKYDTLAVGSPTYNNDIFPPVRNFLHGVFSRMVKNHKFVSFGSYSWVGGSVKMMNEMAKCAGFELISDGLSFKHGYSHSKCDFSSIIDSISIN